MEDAKTMADMVAVQSAKQKSSGKSAIPDAAYDPRSSVVRAKYEGMTPVEIAKSALPPFLCCVQKIVQPTNI